MRNIFYLASLYLMLLFAMSGCASGPNVQRDCVIEGTGPYYKCQPYSAFRQDCNRWK